jgi:hypothetical protein
MNSNITYLLTLYNNYKIQKQMNAEQSIRWYKAGHTYKCV